MLETATIHEDHPESLAERAGSRSQVELGEGSREQPEDEDTDQLDRVTVNLTKRAATALETLTRLTGDSTTDAVNRALQVHAFLEQAVAQGGTIYVRRSVGSRLERLIVA